MSPEDTMQAVGEFEVAFPRDGDVELCYRRVKRSPGGVREDGIDNEAHSATAQQRYNRMTSSHHAMKDRHKG